MEPKLAASLLAIAARGRREHCYLDKPGSASYCLDLAERKSALCITASFNLFTATVEPGTAQFNYKR